MSDLPRIEARLHARHEFRHESFHETWTERWEVGSHGSRLVELICEECGRVIVEPRFYRGKDGRDLLTDYTCEEVRVQEVMES